MVFAENIAHVCLDILGQADFKLARDFTTPLAVTISDREEVAIFETTEVRHGDPTILVGLVRVRWRLASLGCESKFGYAVCKHLFRVRSVEAVLHVDECALRHRVLHVELWLLARLIRLLSRGFSLLFLSGSLLLSTVVSVIVLLRILLLPALVTI